MWGVSTIKYYKNTIILRPIMCLPSYRHKAFSTQIFGSVPQLL